MDSGAFHLEQAPEVRYSGNYASLAGDLKQPRLRFWSLQPGDKADCAPGLGLSAKAPERLEFILREPIITHGNHWVI